MPSRLKVLSGRDVIKILGKYGFIKTRSVGSHLRLTYLNSKESFHITIPIHRELKKGLLSSIVKELEFVISKDELIKDFYIIKK